MSSNFAIVDLKGGQQTDKESFLISNDSFPVLENAYLFRGRIERRSGFKSVGVDGRLKFAAGSTDGAGNITLLDGTVGSGIPAGVASFVISGDTLTDPGGASPVVLLTTGTVTGTLNRSTGVLATNAANTPVVYIPGLPVMGLRVLENVAVNDEALMAFDDRWTYLFDTGTNDFIGANTFAGTTNQFVWTGTNSDLFWSTNYFSAFWATNNNAGYHAAQNISPVAEGDGIRWYGTVATVNGWRNFNPQITSTPTYLLGGLIILPYKDRLVVLNTLEGANLAGSTRFAQRARWCQNGTPFYGDFPDGRSAQVDAWRSDVVGKGGFIDAPTQEAIISAEFVKDTLIVYFERSTWQLVYNYNETLPFIWQKINTELGTESTFSIVPFDRGAFGVGNYGIITCDSVNVARIDQKIPDEVFKIQNKNNGVKRVSGIRDYNAQLVYWAYPILDDQIGNDVTYDLTYPNQVLVYNYLEGSWSQFDDCFTCFGYWQKLTDATWASLAQSWQSAGFTWNSQVNQARYPDVIAGNQRGFVLVFSQLQNIAINSPSIPISNLSGSTISAPDHNFVVNDYLLITGCLGSTNLNNSIVKVVAATVSTITIDATATTGTYTGKGLLTHIPNILIQTKEFNPYYQQGDSVRLNYIDMYMDRTSEGEITAQFFTSDNTSTPIETATVLTSSEPQPTYSQPSPTSNYSLTQSKVWHRIYTNSYGSFFQNIFTLSDAQMRDLNTATSDITIHGLIYYVSPAARLSYDI